MSRHDTQFQEPPAPFPEGLPSEPFKRLFFAATIDAAATVYRQRDGVLTTEARNAAEWLDAAAPVLAEIGALRSAEMVRDWLREPCAISGMSLCELAAAIGRSNGYVWARVDDGRIAAVVDPFVKQRHQSVVPADEVARVLYEEGAR
jgi:hypothetical protein